ncbi:MAG: hypothetical protein ACRYF3_10735 [Janthinobacterium lividum]
MESQAYQSSLTLFSGTDKVPVAPGPGPVTDAADEQLADLRRRIVDPVVTGFFTPEELGEVSVHWVEHGDPGDTYVRITAVQITAVRTTAVDEVFGDWLTSDTWRGEHGPLSDAEYAARLADHLEDWFCETRIGWGQQRRASYEPPE